MVFVEQQEIYVLLEPPMDLYPEHTVKMTPGHVKVHEGGQTQTVYYKILLSVHLPTLDAVSQMYVFRVDRYGQCAMFELL